ncbi:glucose-1-phosphate thymidylyltransferase [Patescibacteria group bacterium]|nr:glucose-1-phosphate thymidylyltransferase [Patescibacteria group bacterium]
MKAIIPTGGRGTRMRPLTFSANKHFIPVANKPLVFYPIEKVAETGIKDVAITYNPGGMDEVETALGDGSRWGLKFTYILQEKPLGLANIVEVCEDFLAGSSFLFHLGDNIFADGIRQAFDYFVKNKPNGLVTMLHHPENKRMGVPYFDKNKKLLKYVEKPENPPHDFAIPGLYFADSNFFKCFKGKDRIKPSARGEFEIPSAFQWMIDHGFNVEVIEYSGKWLDPGKFDDWLNANEYLLSRDLQANMGSEIDRTSEIKGKVSIGVHTKIRSSKLNGPVVIGDNVIIENSEIGPFASIGSDCEVLNSKIKRSVLMDGVRVSGVANRPIEDSLIGTDSEITGLNNRSVKTNLFIGEKCKIQI